MLVEKQILIFVYMKNIETIGTMKDEAKKRGSGLRKFLCIFTVSILSVVLVILILLQLILSENTIKRLADKYIPQYVDANVGIGGISVSVFKSFPNIDLNLSKVDITYPHTRFAQYDSVGVPGLLRKAGRGVEADTLASFASLECSINWLSAFFGRIHLNNIALRSPRIFAHSYAEGVANWDVIRNLSTTETADTSITVLPPISIKRISLTGKPAAVYTDCADTVYAGIFFSKFLFRGKLHSRDMDKTRLGLTLDSLLVSGRLPSDTLALFLDHLKAEEDEGVIHFNSSAKAFAGMSSYGRIILPITTSGDLSFYANITDTHEDTCSSDRSQSTNHQPKDKVQILDGHEADSKAIKYQEQKRSGNSKVISLDNFKADIATISLSGNALIAPSLDSTYIRAEASVDNCRISDILHTVGKNFFPALDSLQTNATMSITALCDGYWNPVRSTLPALLAEISVPQSFVRYPGIPDGSIATYISAEADNGALDVDISNLDMNFAGFSLSLSGSASNMSSEKAEISIKANAEALLDELASILPDTLGCELRGKVQSVFELSGRLADMNATRFRNVLLGGNLRADSLYFRSITDTLSVITGNLLVTFRTASSDAKWARTIPVGSQILAFDGHLDSLTASLPGIHFFADRISLLAGNADEGFRVEQSLDVSPSVANMHARNITLSMADSISCRLQNVLALLACVWKEHGESRVPFLSVSASTESMLGRMGLNRLNLNDASISASANMTTFERNLRRKYVLDSLQRIYPGVHRDTLSAMARRRFRSRIASRSDESGFADRDFSLDFGKDISRYLREWNVTASAGVKEGLVITPYFPLRNKISDLRLIAGGDKIRLEHLTLLLGKSDITATGEIANLRRGLYGISPLTMNLSLTSTSIDADEMLSAYTAGATFSPVSATSAASSLSDSEYIKDIEANAQQDSLYALIVIPGNIEASITMEAGEVKYSDLAIDWMESDMKLKDRCLQITNTVATSNMGDIYFEGFYSTRSKTDITAGFDLNMADITADKVVRLFPAVDSIMPMLKSFQGQLDCEMAATTALDTNMNILTPTMKGVMKIRGRDVALVDSPEFRKIASTLMFKDKKFGRIGDMSVSGLIRDNKIEIFPFVLNVDRYLLAMSGLQQFDQSFRYHVSVLKSPLPIRFGVDLYGNFDDWKYKIGKAKYKNTAVPVFTSEIDAVQLNLVRSIHNIFVRGVEMAVKQNDQMQDALEVQKRKLGYDSESEVDELDESDRQALHQASSEVATEL